MRIRIERTFLTTHSATRVVEVAPEYITTEAESLSAAILQFISGDQAKLLGTISDDERRASATAWKNRLYRLLAEPAD